MNAYYFGQSMLAQEDACQLLGFIVPLATLRNSDATP